MGLDSVDDTGIELTGLGAQTDGQRDVQFIEQVEETPDTDAVAVVAPGPVGNLRVFHEQRLDGGAGLAPDEMLDRQHGPDGHSCASGPAQWGTIDDRGVRGWLHSLVPTPKLDTGQRSVKRRLRPSPGPPAVALLGRPGLPYSAEGQRGAALEREHESACVCGGRLLARAE